MTHKHDSLPTSANVRWQAAFWYLRLKERRGLAVSEGLRFLAWAARSPEHFGEIRRLRRLDDSLARLMRARPGRSSRTQRDVQSARWRESSFRQAHYRVVGWRIAAAALLVLPILVFFASRSLERPEGIVTTAAHELKTQRLADGSEVSLASDSSLRVNFTPQRRHLQLHQGKATFNVVRDAQRPFVVGTFLVDITAVESTFSVSIDSSVEVTVYEGAVSISGRAVTPGAAVVTVKKGEMYRVPVEGLAAIVAGGGALSRAERVTGSSG